MIEGDDIMSNGGDKGFTNRPGEVIGVRDDGDGEGWVEIGWRDREEGKVSVIDFEGNEVEMREGIEDGEGKELFIEGEDEGVRFSAVVSGEDDIGSDPGTSAEDLHGFRGDGDGFLEGIIDRFGGGLRGRRWFRRDGDIIGARGEEEEEEEEGQ